MDNSTAAISTVYSRDHVTDIINCRDIFILYKADIIQHTHLHCFVYLMNALYFEFAIIRRHHDLVISYNHKPWSNPKLYIDTNATDVWHHWDNYGTAEQFQSYQKLLWDITSKPSLHVQYDVNKRFDAHVSVNRNFNFRSKKEKETQTFRDCCTVFIPLPTNVYAILLATNHPFLITDSLKGPGCLYGGLAVLCDNRCKSEFQYDAESIYVNTDLNAFLFNDMGLKNNVIIIQLGINESTTKKQLKTNQHIQIKYCLDSTKPDGFDCKCRDCNRERIHNGQPRGRRDRPTELRTYSKKINF